MNTTPTAAAPGWFRIAAVLLLLWNLFGCYMFFSQYTMAPEAIAALPEAQRTLWNNLPGWLWVVYGVAVVSGVLGALCLLLRKRAAVMLFWISLVAVLVQFSQVFFPGGALELMGPAMALPMPLLIAAVAALAVWVARRGVARGWLV